MRPYLAWGLASTPAVEGVRHAAQPEFRSYRCWCGERIPAGARPSSGAATGFLQATEHFPTACPPDFAAAGTAALRYRRNSNSEFGLRSCALGNRDALGRDAPLAPGETPVRQGARSYAGSRRRHSQMCPRSLPPQEKIHCLRCRAAIACRR
jgi:hypothetical protein